METLTWGWDERLIKDGEDPVLRTDSVFQMRDVLEWYVSYCICNSGAVHCQQCHCRAG